MKGTDPGRLQRQPSCLSPTASGTETHGGCDSRRCPVTLQKAACGGHGKVTTLRFSVPPLPRPLPPGGGFKEKFPLSEAGSAPEEGP